MLTLTKLTVSGFRSVRDPVTYEYRNGCALVHGENGGGKTSIAAEAPYWCLFGEPLRGKYAESVINREADATTVDLDFTLSDGRTGTMHRKRPRKGKVVFTVKLSDGTDLLAGAGTAMRSFKTPVEALLGMSKDTLRRVSFFDTKEGFLTLDYAPRVRVLKDIIGTQWVEEARKRAKEKEDIANDTYATASAHAARKAGASAEATKAAQALAQQRAEAEKRAVENARARLDQLLTRQTELGAAVDAATAEAATATAALQAAREALGALERERDVALAGIREFCAGPLAMAEQFATEAKKAESLASKRMVDLNSAGSCCPVCCRELDPRARAAAEEVLRQEMGKLRTESYSAQEVLGEATRTRVEMEKDVRDATSPRVQALNRQQQAVTQAHAEVTRLEAQAARLRGELGALVRQVEEALALAQDPSQAQGIKALAEAEEGARKGAEQAQLEADGANATQIKAERELTVAKWWKEGLGPKGLQAFLVETVLPRLEATSNYYLRQMSQGQLGLEIKPTHQTQKGDESEGIEVLVRNTAGIDSYDDDSTGERKLADLAVALALFDLAVAQGGGGLGFLALDEALDGMDATRAGQALETLALQGAQGRSIHVISHSDAVRSGHLARMVHIGRGDDGWTHVTPSGEAEVQTAQVADTTRVPPPPGEAPPPPKKPRAPRKKKVAPPAELPGQGTLAAETPSAVPPAPGVVVTRQEALELATGITKTAERERLEVAAKEAAVDPEDVPEEPPPAGPALTLADLTNIPPVTGPGKLWAFAVSYCRGDEAKARGWLKEQSGCGVEDPAKMSDRLVVQITKQVEKLLAEGCYYGELPRRVPDPAITPEWRASLEHFGVEVPTPEDRLAAAAAEEAVRIMDGMPKKGRAHPPAAVPDTPVYSLDRGALDAGIVLGLQKLGADAHTRTELIRTVAPGCTCVASLTDEQAASLLELLKGKVGG